MNQNKNCEEEPGIDPVYFLKLPVLNDKMEDQNLIVGPQVAEDVDDDDDDDRYRGFDVEDRARMGGRGEDEAAQPVSDNNLVQLRFLGEDPNKNSTPEKKSKNKRKRSRTVKTSEEVENQRMTHIAVERLKRKRMRFKLQREIRSAGPRKPKTNDQIKLNARRSKQSINLSWTPIGWLKHRSV